MLQSKHICIRARRRQRQRERERIYVKMNVFAIWSSILHRNTTEYEGSNSTIHAIFIWCIDRHISFEIKTSNHSKGEIHLIFGRSCRLGLCNWFWPDDTTDDIQWTWLTTIVNQTEGSRWQKPFSIACSIQIITLNFGLHCNFAQKLWMRRSLNDEWHGDEMKVGV